MHRIRRIEQYTKTKMNKMAVPAVSEILDRRADSIVKEIVANIEGKDFPYENKIIGDILEQGYSLEQIAAGLLNLRIGQSAKKYKEIDAVQPARERGERREKGKAPRRNEVRLHINVGTAERVKAKDFVSMVTKKSDIPARAIGDIDLYKKFSFINVDKAYASQIMKKLNSKVIGGRSVKAEQTAK